MHTKQIYKIYKIKTNYYNVKSLIINIQNHNNCNKTILTSDQRMSYLLSHHNLSNSSTLALAIDQQQVEKFYRERQMMNKKLHGVIPNHRNNQIKNQFDIKSTLNQNQTQNQNQKSNNKLLNSSLNLYRKKSLIHKIKEQSNTLLTTINKSMEDDQEFNQSNNIMSYTNLQKSNHKKFKSENIKNKFSNYKTILNQISLNQSKSEENKSNFGFSSRLSSLSLPQSQYARKRCSSAVHQSRIIHQNNLAQCKSPKKGREKIPLSNILKKYEQEVKKIQGQTSRLNKWSKVQQNREIGYQNNEAYQQIKDFHQNNEQISCSDQQHHENYQTHYNQQNNNQNYNNFQQKNEIKKQIINKSSPYFGMLKDNALNDYNSNRHNDNKYQNKEINQELKLKISQKKNNNSELIYNYSRNIQSPQRISKVLPLSTKLAKQNHQDTLKSYFIQQSSILSANACDNLSKYSNNLQKNRIDSEKQLKSSKANQYYLKTNQYSKSKQNQNSLNSNQPYSKVKTKQYSISTSYPKSSISLPKITINQQQVANTIQNQSNKSNSQSITGHQPTLKSIKSQYETKIKQQQTQYHNNLKLQQKQFQAKFKQQQLVINQLQKQNNHFNKFINSINKMKSKLQETEVQYSSREISKIFNNSTLKEENLLEPIPNLKDLWRWIKSLPTQKQKSKERSIRKIR